MNLKLRYIFVFVFIGLFALYIIIYYANLIFNEDVYSSNRSPEEMIERGTILDRNGRILALQLRYADISVWRPLINDIDLLSDELAVILDMTPAEIRLKINSSESDYLFLKRQIDDASARRISLIIDEKKIEGVKIEPIIGRLYPEKTLASHVIGFVGDGNKGLEGIEFALNDILDGIDNNGKGAQVYLTIDTYVQYILEEIALNTLEKTGAEAVMLLAMDPRSGDILGSVSVPGFDPNNFNVFDDISRMNRPVIWAYEPGSVFKIFTMSALLDSGAITGDTVFYCDGVYHTSTGGIINCLGSHGAVTAREIIIYSCNAGAAYASDHLGNNAFYQSLRNFGFGSRTGAGSPGETSGILASSEAWYNRTKPTLAIGQEISVSAYQMLQAASAIANNGILVPPRIISRIVSEDGKNVTPWENGEPRRVISEETARAMRSYMVDAASDIGTGWRAAVDDLSLAVKTGTAQMNDPVTRRYSDTDFIASCIALLPSDSPELVLYLAIIKPQGEIYGGRIAAPAIREAAEALIDHIGIPRGRNPQIDHPSAINIPVLQISEIRDYIPDFTGLAKRVLLPLLLREDINVRINGDGWVRRQEPPPGTPVTKGMNIILELE